MIPNLVQENLTKPKPIIKYFRVHDNMLCDLATQAGNCKSARSAFASDSASESIIIMHIYSYSYS